MKKCILTGKKPLVGHNISHSNRKTLMRQEPNLQFKRIWNAKRGTWLRLRLSTSAIRTLDKIGLEEFARRTGIAI